MYSAVPQEGRRLYELARRGIDVAREPRPVFVRSIAVEAVAPPCATLRVVCGKGTYVRVLAADLGAALGCGAAVERLVRARVGPFTLAAAVAWADLASGEREALWARVRPPEAAVAVARRHGLGSLGCTFDPHPLEVLQPARAPVPLTPLPDRLALIAETGVDAAVVVAFTREVAAVEPEAFVRDVLVERLKARDVVVGFNHRFGRGARRAPALLEALAPRLGFRAHVVAPLEVEGTAVSSSEVRAALQAGDLERAARLLRRPYSAEGEVVRRPGRGRTLGC